MFKRSITIPAILYFLSFLTIIISIVQAIQIPLGALPEDSIRLAAAPVSHFMHVIGGAVFGILGPIQFGRVLAAKYGRAHRVMGRIFVVAGASLSLSSFSLLWQFPADASAIVSGGRLVFGIALGIALIFAMLAIRRGNYSIHRNWMIRAYALGIGATVVSIIFLPIFIITGEPPMGLMADVAFIGMWAVCVLFAELLVRRLEVSKN